MATIATTATSTQDCAEAFQTSVGVLIGQGMSRQEATAKMAKQFPKLHQAFLDHTNPNAAARPTMASEEDRQSVFTEYNAAVEAAMQSNGGDRRRAVATVGRRNPELQKRFERIYCRVPIGR